MVRLTPEQIVTLLISLGALLATARLLGELARRFHQPSIVGELLAGLVLGPTLLGRLAPGFHDTLFPPGDDDLRLLIQGIALLAIVMFLLVAGIEVDLSTVWRLGRAALSVSVGGIAVPFALGLAAAYAMPGIFHIPGGVKHNVFALFLATALSISALPVIAKTLLDLRLFRSDIGMVVISAAVIDDLAGWTLFAVLLGMMGEVGAGLGAHRDGSVGMTIFLTLLFAGSMLTLGRFLIHRSLAWVNAHASWPGGILGFAMVLALLGAALTEWIGVHAIFGAFFVGVAIGDSSHLRQHTRTILEQFVSFIFAPLFFATIGLRIDFLAHFDVMLVLTLFAIACVAKVIGCTSGARIGGMSKRESLAVGFGMNARGAMGTILALLALERGVIEERMFVALVVMAIGTSILSGPVMQRILRMPRPRHLADYLDSKAFAGPIRASDRRDVIDEIAIAVCGRMGLSFEKIRDAVWMRESAMATGVGGGIAVPHARIEGLAAPIIGVGLSQAGIDFDAPDGEPAQLIFMILTPRDEEGVQVEILAEIARTFRDGETRGRALRAKGYTEFLSIVKTSASDHEPHVAMAT